jgi:RNA polymerase subunit RPABC4/transcription elongation factor Spt4
VRAEGGATLAAVALFRRSSADASARDERPRAPKRAAPAAGELRRERRALLRAREERVRDLGGLALEMYRQDSFREHVLYEQCAEVAAMEDRLLELDVLLDIRRPPASRCTCGAPLFWGTRFCGHCGRAVGEGGDACAHCGHTLSADAAFCPACGSHTADAIY